MEKDRRDNSRGRENQNARSSAYGYRGEPQTPSYRRTEEPRRTVPEKREAERGAGAKGAPRETGRRDSSDARKSRRKNSLFPNVGIYLLFVFGVSAILAAIGWTAANDVLALNKEHHRAVITIAEDESFDSVVDELADGGIIEYKAIFQLFSFFAGGADKISPGTYQLDTDMDYNAILNSLGSGSSARMTTVVTIPEGYTLKQIFKTLEENGVCSVSKLEEMAANHNYNFSFLLDIPLGDPNRLEGFLYPDTYEFFMGENPLYVLNKMLVNFDARVTDKMREAIEKRGYSVRELVIMASMIEKETDGEDRANIASVIFNRLEKPTRETAGFLNIDATIQYVLPEGQKVTAADYEGVVSPYNTYLNKGLPPGPIGSPGFTSLNAVLNPNNTKYYFYSLGTDGKHHFFRNHSEQLAFLNGEA